MKKIIYTFLILCLSLSFVSDVLAEEFNISLTGSDNIDKNITVNLTVDNLSEYNTFYGMTATLEYDSEKLDLSLIKGLNNFDLTYNSKTKKIVLYNPKGIQTKNDILTIKFNNTFLKQDESTTINLKNITSTDGNKDIKISNIIKKITNTSEKIDETKIQSSNLNNNYLSSIKINNKSVDFSKENLNYDIVVGNDTTKIEITAIPEDANATISGTGSYNLEEGSNTIELLVTSTSGNERTYIINVNREKADVSVDDKELFIQGDNKTTNNILLFVIPIICILILSLIIVKMKRKDK